MKGSAGRTTKRAEFVGIPIERGIPLAPRTSPSGPRTDIAIALERLEPGESFAVPATRIKQLSGAVYCSRKRTGARYAVRRVGEFARVWRLT